MSSPVVFKNLEWDLTKSKYDEIDNLPLMRTPGPVLTILAAYLLFVLKVGPAFMRKREAYKLKYTLLVYNVFQVGLSIFLMATNLYYVIRMGLFPKECYIEQKDWTEQMITGIWWYFAAKVTELLDTVFFVLRKKDNQISFLHLYHHSIMVIGTWCTLKYTPSHLFSFIGFLNSLVHVLMYTYYGLAAFGDKYAKYLTWKKYMTTFQLVQFVMIVFQFVISGRNSDCPPSKFTSTMIASNTVFILMLFLNFYRQNYRSKKPKSKANGNAASETNGVYKKVH